MVNNIKNNKISEISAKKGLNTLIELKNAEITRQKKRNPKQKELLNLFNNLSDTILADEILESKCEEDDKNENKNVNENKNDNVNVNENENVNENDETLMSWNKDNENKNQDDDETMSQNKVTKELNDHFDEIIDKSKSFEEQIKSLKKTRRSKRVLAL